MHKLQFDNDGRELVNDDLEILQRETLAAALAVYQGASDFVVSGCRLTQAGNAGRVNVAGGLVYLGGELLRCNGASAVELPAALIAGPVTTVQDRAYEDGSTRPGITQQLVQVVPLAAVPAGAAYVRVYETGCLSWFHVRQMLERPIGEVQFLASVPAGQYDATGLGKPGTAAWGWALVNGANGTANAAGRFPLIIGGSYALGARGGEATHALTQAELPGYLLSSDAAKRTTSANDYSVTFDGGSSGARAWQYSAGTTSISSGGSNMPHNNMPPWFGFAARQWVGI